MRIKDVGTTVEALLAGDALPGARLLAGESGLDRVVIYAAQMDGCGPVLPTPQGALLLARLPLSAGEANDAEPFLRRLVTAGAAGLGLQSGGAPLPAAVMQTANHLAFPLLEMPKGVPVPQLVNSVLTQVLKSQAQTLDTVQELNRALTSTMLHGGSLQEICRALYQHFGNSVAISSDLLSSYVLSSTGEKEPAIRAILEEEKRGANLGRQGAPKQAARVPDALGGRIVLPIYIDNLPQGRIAMWEDFKTLSAVELSVLESATSLIAMDLMKKTSILHIENSNRGGFLGGLLSGDRRQHQKALANARHFDFDAATAHLVMVIRLQKPRRQDAPYRLGAGVIGILQQTVRSTAIKIIYANQGDQVILLLEAIPGGPAAFAGAVDDFIATLQRRFAAGGLGGMLAVGVGRAYLAPAELYKSLAEARRALAFPGGGVARFEDIGLYRILSHESLQAELELFCGEMLRPLWIHDRARGARLLETLAEYFTCGRNLTHMAQRLGVHYNTVANRLQKIQELTGLSLDDADNSLNLQVALKIYEMDAAHMEEPHKAQ